MPAPEVKVDHINVEDTCLDVSAVAVHRQPARDGVEPFALSIVGCAGKGFLVDVLPTDTLKYVKDVIWGQTGISPDEQQLEIAGHRLDSGATIAQSGLSPQSTVTLFRTDAQSTQSLPVPNWSARPGPPGLKFTRRSQRPRSRSPLDLFRKETEAEKQGLQPRAKAVALRDWTGVIPNGPKGLKITKDQELTIGRVVNADWYQGYSGVNDVGYVPRTFVRITEVCDVSITPELGADAPKSPKSQPSLPPAPFTPKLDLSEYDVTDKYARVAVVFAPTLTLTPPFPLTIMLTLVAAPGRRIAHATFRASFLDGTIGSLSPSDFTGVATEVHHADSEGGEVELNLGTAGTLPAQAGAAVRQKLSRAEEYARHTWGRIQGSGVGLREAFWVFEEDQGKGGRHGIPVAKSTETLTLGLSVRPAVCMYEVEVTVVEGDGDAPGYFNTKKHKSGIQRVLLG